MKFVFAIALTCAIATTTVNSAECTKADNPLSFPICEEVKKEACKNLAMICNGSIRPRPADVTFEDCMDEVVKGANQAMDTDYPYAMAQITTDCECPVITCGAKSKSTFDVEKLEKTVKKTTVILAECTKADNPISFDTCEHMYGILWAQNGFRTEKPVYCAQFAKMCYDNREYEFRGMTFEGCMDEVFQNAKLRIQATPMISALTDCECPVRTCESIQTIIDVKNQVTDVIQSIVDPLFDWANRVGIQSIGEGSGGKQRVVRRRRQRRSN